MQPQIMYIAWLGSLQARQLDDQARLARPNVLLLANDLPRKLVTLGLSAMSMQQKYQSDVSECALKGAVESEAALKCES